MEAERLELVRGIGNVFRDLGRENADMEQLKALLAAEIIQALDRDGLTIPEAQTRTGLAAAEFSRIATQTSARWPLIAWHRFSIIWNRGSKAAPVPAQS